mmetsp:Transcript_57615/g.151640  ORF Transcript_57615/g.151640 Transcript_57615/m.151640 type:complete len:86 (-) Transcript_57615:238-495(-)
MRPSRRKLSMPICSRSTFNSLLLLIVVCNISVNVSERRIDATQSHIASLAEFESYPEILNNRGCDSNSRLWSAPDANCIKYETQP